MPFNHNDHYHRLLLGQVPRGCRRALDVGCGTGRFARRLAQQSIEVDAVDRSAEAIQAARGISPQPSGLGRVRYRHADMTTVRLPKGHYDYISCLASIHQMPFGIVTALREALAPGGVLVILGVYRERTPTDYAVSLAAVPVNAAARLAVVARENLKGIRVGNARSQESVQAAVTPAPMTLGQIKEVAAALLPGCVIRRRLFWRYVLVYRRPAPEGKTEVARDRKRSSL